jgi:hypothetical protein
MPEKKQTLAAEYLLGVNSLFVPWCSRSRGSSPSVHRIQGAVARRRAENAAVPPLKGNRSADT